MRSLLSLRAVASLIPCHPRTLRVMLGDQRRAERAPRPLPRPNNEHPYRFERSAVERWLLNRAALRDRSGKPHLRWCDPSLDVGQAAPAPEAVEERTEATIALRLRAHLADTLGNRLSPQDIDKHVLAVLHRTREARELELA
jgi:hypothetical protein